MPRRTLSQPTLTRTSRPICWCERSADRITRRIAGDRSRLRVLEIACGTGLSQAYLSRTNPEDLVVGIDRSAAMLTQSHSAARSRWASASIGTCDGTASSVRSRCLRRRVRDQIHSHLSRQGLSRRRSSARRATWRAARDRILRAAVRPAGVRYPPSDAVPGVSSSGNTRPSVRCEG